MKFYTYRVQVPLKPGEKLGFKKGRGYYAIPAKPPPPPPNVFQSVFAGKGIFTAWDPAAAIGLKADWAALQLDAEGGHSATVTDLRQAGYKLVFGWQARPDLQGVLDARNQGLDGYIGQAESQAELDACLSLGGVPRLPHALVGNPTAWTDQGHAEAKAQGWELLVECYWNVQPWTGPAQVDTKGYPAASIVYGVYDATAENPPYGRRVPLSDYLVAGRAWPNWSVYLAETMTAEDRAVMS